MFVFTIVGFCVTMGFMLIGVFYTAAITIPPLAHSLRSLVSQAYHKLKEGSDRGPIGMGDQSPAVDLQPNARG